MRRGCDRDIIHPISRHCAGKMYKQNNLKIFLGKKGYIRLFQTKSSMSDLEWHQYFFSILYVFHHQLIDQLLSSCSFWLCYGLLHPVFKAQSHVFEDAGCILPWFTQFLTSVHLKCTFFFHFLLPPSLSHSEVLPHPTLMLGVTLLSLHLHSSPPSASILVRGESIVLLTEDLFSGAIICCSLIQFLSFNLFPGINISLLQPPRYLVAVHTTMQPHRVGNTHILLQH